MKYGLIPELVGRIPVIASLDPLDREAYIRILSEPKNALIKQYAKLLEMDGVELNFTREATEAIADKAIELNTGARGLRSIMEKLMTGYMYSLPSDKSVKKLTITKEMVS